MCSHEFFCFMCAFMQEVPPAAVAEETIPCYNVCLLYLSIRELIYTYAHYIYEDDEKQEAEVPPDPSVPEVPQQTEGGLPGVPDKVTLTGKEIDLRDAYFPPPHVKSCGTVYSNAYRKSMAANGQNTEVAKADAKRATAIFQQYKVVTTSLCGKFRAAPRKTKDAPAPQEPLEPIDDGEGEEVPEEAS